MLLPKSLHMEPSPELKSPHICGRQGHALSAGRVPGPVRLLIANFCACFAASVRCKCVPRPGRGSVGEGYALSTNQNLVQGVAAPTRDLGS
jgi:hypothetical protein